MKIRTKMALLLILYVGIFVTLIVLYKSIEDRRLSAIFQEESKSRIESIRHILDITEKPLETFAYDYTIWDEMVTFIATRDRAWAQINIDVSLKTYNVNAIWVCSADGSIVYSTDNADGALKSALPLSGDELRRLFAVSRFCHFFIATPRGPMEIRGATVHASTDNARKTEPVGIFFAGRLWDEGYLRKLSEISGAKITICDETLKKRESVSDASRGLIMFHKTFDGVDGLPIGCLNISSRSATISVFKQDSQQMLLILLFYAAALFVMLYAALMVWVSEPLNAISLALSEKSAAHIKNLLINDNEFGRIAQLIDSSFRQTKELLSEITERKRSDGELLLKMKELEVTYRQLQDTQGRLVQSEKLAALGRFASGVAHEVKNPLAILLGGLEYLKAKLTGGDPDLQEAVIKMREAVMRADIIINDLLTFAKPSRVIAEATHPNTLVNDAVSFVDLFKHKSDTADVTMHLDLTDKDIRVEVDKNQMQQVLFNVLLNAIEATPMKGDIYIKTYADMAALPDVPHEKRAVCVIEIQDTGAGISKDNLPKLFEPFFTTKRDRKGTGLGLSIVKSIVERHKGAINIESEPGKGTTVKILLPIKRSPKKEA